ncbi:MAG: carboxypeptidase-like regulatory domain-containing protein, partial [Bacteroidales bacterium]|nr:carboxypeptidase-like regulatory domain-containing protein [Bacteroidales bacterium]
MKIFVVSLWVLLALHVGIYSQEKIPVHGIVTDNSDMPIPGATVYLVTNKTGAVTDSSGRYSFVVPARGRYIILASFIGYKTYTDTLLITGSTSLPIKLLPDVVALSEVVVRENYESTRNRKEALSVEVIKSDFILQNNAGNLIKPSRN